MSEIIQLKGIISLPEDGSSGFKAEKGRYHLYAAWGCPYANRTLIGRKIKGLEDVITLNVVHTLNTPPEGWIFLGEVCVIFHG